MSSLHRRPQPGLQCNEHTDSHWAAQPLNPVYFLRDRLNHNHASWGNIQRHLEMPQ